MCELRLAEGKLFLFLAIDRVSKLTRVAFFDANTKRNGAAAFLRVVVAAFPDRIPTVLTDNRWRQEAIDPICAAGAARRPRRAWPSPLRRSTATGRRRAGWATSSTVSAASTGSPPSSPSPTTPAAIR